MAEGTAQITDEQVDKVLAAVKESFRAYLNDDGEGPKILLNWADHDVVIAWEDGPFEWAILASLGGVDEEAASIAADFGVPFNAEIKPVRVDGIFLEPVNGCVLGVYPA